MNLLSRQDALAQGSSTYFTGAPCKHGHVASRFTTTRQCVTCSSVKAAAYHARTGRVRSKARHIERTYGLTSAEYEALLQKQNGRCAICCEEVITAEGSLAKAAVVDHYHKTGKVRGILCNHYNRALGLFRDNPIFLRSAIAYLS
jgi:hypothetical protein